MDAARLWRIATWLFAVPCAVLACFLPFLRWVPRFDFDVLGFAWVLVNIPNLACWTLFLLCGGMALYCRFRSLMESQ